MKIGLIIYGSLETLSGGYLYDRQLVAYLRAAGAQVDILSLPWRSYGAHLLDNMQLEWARQIARSHYDLLLEDELNHPSLFLLNTLLRRLCACPIISVVHHLRSAEDHPASLLPLYRIVERRYLRSVDGFIYNSQTTRRIVEQELGTKAPHIVTYPAADHRQPPPREVVLETLARRIHSSRPLQLLFVGNLIARKGLHTVLNALARQTSLKWHLHVAGSQEIDPTYSATMRHRANTLSLSKRITWHGRVSDDALAGLFTAADLLVMPSYEGFGIVFLEAMAYGLPVFAANVGAAAEIVEPGVNGYLIPIADDRTLAEQIALVQTNRVHLATLGYHARQRYESHPTWQESMASAYRWLCEVSINSPFSLNARA
jgi:glycosyltransferase involved in cell wall biosynthesis